MRRNRDIQIIFFKKCCAQFFSSKHLGVKLKRLQIFMTLYQIIISFVFIFAMSIGAASDESSTSLFAIGKYAQSKTNEYTNNLKLSKILTIPGADELEITITGSIEKCCQSDKVTHKCCDYLTIFDHNNHEIGKYSGNINKKFTVPGASIRVTFKSDNRTTDKGVLVSISERLPASVFNEIKTQLLETTENILKQATKEAYLKIGENLQLFKTLHAKITKTQNIDSIINEVTAALISIARTYREIATMDAKIIAVHQIQFEIYAGLKNKTLYNISKLEKKKQVYLSKLDEVQTQLTRIENTLEKQKAQFSIDGYKNIVQSLYAQQVIWTKFYEVQENLETKLHSHSQKIELLLHILNINSQIYEQSANVALLRKSTVLTLNNLTNSTGFKKIIADIRVSETEIKQWLEQIEQTELMVNG